MALSSSLNLRIGIDVSNLSRELTKVEKQLARFGGQMESMGSKMTQSFTLPLLGLGAAALKSFADIEKLENGLIAIMGSSQAASTELEKLRKVAENPGLALPQVVQASATLQSVGMSADAARETITQFGNAVARSGGNPEDFGGVVRALGQISAVGKVTQEDLNQIKERLPEFATVMKNEFGAVTAEAIRGMGVSSEDFIKRSVSALGKLERAKGGLANTFDNLKDNVSASLASLGKSINTSLNLEAVAASLSAKIQLLVDGFNALNPTTQGYIVKFALFVAAIGPALFIIGKLATGFSAIIGIGAKLATMFGYIQKAIYAVGAALKFLAANPYVIAIVAAIAAIGAIALYVYDNWQAFSDNFKNIWITIINIAKSGVNGVLGAISKMQKATGIKLFDDSTLKPYQLEQRIVATEFKSIGDTVDSLQGKLKSLFTSGAKPQAKQTLNVLDTTNDDTKPPPSGAGAGAGVVKNMPMAAVGLLPTLDLLPNKLKSAKAETDALKDSTNALATAQIAAGNAVQYVDEKMSALNKMNVELTEGLNKLIEGTLENLAMSFGETLGKVLAGGKFQLKDMLGVLADALIAFGRMAIQAGITAIALKKALTLGQATLAVAAGIALIAIGTAIKSGAAVPKLAQGGLAYAPTMAMVGDNKNARVDPEVIAPLSKLKGMMGDMGIGGTLETRISGNDLLILLNRSGKGLNRVQ